MKADELDVYGEGNRGCFNLPKPRTKLRLKRSRTNNALVELLLA